MRDLGRAAASLAILWAAGATPLPARAEFFTIEDYQVDVKVRDDSLLEIEERISVEFSSPRHGIARRLPVSYVIEAAEPGDVSERASRPWLVGNRYTYAFLDLMVFFKEEYRLRREGDYQVIRLGSPDRLVSGNHTYLIRYSLYGGINFFKDRSELYWNVIGHEWDVPIRQAGFTVMLPDGREVAHDDVFVFSGRRGSRATEVVLKVEPGKISGETSRALGPREGVTLGIRFPAGYLKEGGPWLQLRLFMANYAYWYLPLLCFLLCYILWDRFGRDLKLPLVVAYYPPKGMTPAEMGLLIDDKLQARDLTAMLFYWGANGFISISELKKEGLFGGLDYEIHRLKALPEDAPSFEKVLFEGLFGLNREIRISALRESFHETLERARGLLEDGVGEELYEKGSRGFRIAFRIGAAGLVAGGFFLVTLRNESLFQLAFFALASLLLLVFAEIMPRKTKRGADRYHRVTGFREFLQRVERPRLERLLQGDPQYFDRTLSYAVVLGLGDEWASRFDGLLSGPPTWYHSSQPYSSRSVERFSTRGLVSSMSNALSNMTADLASKPSHSASGISGFGSSSGGGGFSGGGGGGGGGGSW